MKNTLIKILLPIYVMSTICGCMSKAAFSTLISKPDHIEQEFSFENQNFNQNYQITKKVIEGTYLGKTKISNIDYYHLQFPNILKGENRYLQLYLAEHSYVNYDGLYSFGIAEETKKSFKSDKIALLFYNYNSFDDKAEIESVMSKYAFQKDDFTEYPVNTFGNVWLYKGTFIVGPATEFYGIEGWDCNTQIERVQRSKIMPFIRPLYGIPVTILCIPVDILGATITGIEIIFFPKRPEALWYPNFVYSIFGEE